MPLTLQTHEWERVPGTTAARLKRLQPYVRLSQGDSAPVYVQRGQFWSEEGLEPLAEVPDWARQAVAQLTPAVRQEVGLDPGGPVPAPNLAVPAQLAPVAEWTCPECGEGFTRRQKSFHVLGHKRRAVQEAGRV